MHKHGRRTHTRHRCSAAANMLARTRAVAVFSRTPVQWRQRSPLSQHSSRSRSHAPSTFRCRPLTTHTTALLDRSIGSGQICLDLISWIGRNIGSGEGVKYWIGLVGSIGIFFFFPPPAILHRDRENIKLSTMHC
jgi:hypothetical protein